jgi:hypothetical protein
MGGWAKNTSVTEKKFIDPTMTPSLLLGVSSASSPHPPLNTCIGLSKPLALGY